MIASLYVGNVMLLSLNLPLIRLWVKVLEIPRPVLTAAILVFATLGTYSISGSITEVMIMYVIGVLGFFMRRFDFPVAPVILGVILGPLMEAQFRRTLLVSDGDFGAFLERPFAVVAVPAGDRGAGAAGHGRLRAARTGAGRGGLGVGAGVARAVALRAAVPVEAHRGRVVVQLPAGGVEDGVDEALHGLARVQVGSLDDHRPEVDGGDVALQHAVGHEDQAVAGLERQRLHLELAIGDRAERRVDLQLHGLDAAVAEPQRRRMAGVDDRRDALA